MTGSIGVILITPEVTGTMQILGIRANVFKSGKLKDVGSMFREMNDDDRELLQGIVMRMYERFLAVVHAGRPGIPADRLRELADGRVFLGPEAKELGLVDEVGTIDDALQAAREAAGLDGEKILFVRYARPLTHRPNVYASGGDLPAQVNVINLPLPEWLREPSPTFMYLWAPGW